MNLDSSFLSISEFITWNKFGKVYRKCCLSFMTMNARSLSNKFTEFLSYLSSLQQKITFILITETWLNEANDTLFEIPGYKSHNYFRTSGVGGGMKLYFLDHITSNIFSDVSLIACEFLIVDTHVPGVGQIRVCGIYRPPNKSIGDFLSCMDTLLETSCNSDIVLLGDFNINTFDVNNSNVQRYINLFESYGLRNEISLSTYVSPSNMIDGSCIDHIWHNLQIRRDSYVLKPNMSDHYAVVTVFQTEVENEPITIKFRDYSILKVQNYLNRVFNEFSCFSGFNVDLQRIF